MSTAPMVSRNLSARMRSARERTDQLYEILKPSSLYAKPIRERHRLIFYLGHLEAFDWNLIGRKTIDAPAFHPEFDRLFEFGIDPPVGQAPDDQPSDWPAVEEVLSYNRRARKIIDELLDETPEQIIHVALEHRLMHAETLAYLFHNLPYGEKLNPRVGLTHQNRAVRNAMISIPAGEAALGQTAGEFGWDNEFDEHRVQVPGFAINKYKITNGEYLEFVKAGAATPHFWRRDGGQWFYRGMFEEIPLPVNAPAYVTHAEASAFARWRGKSLPTEAQFHRAAFGTSSGDERAYPWGDSAPDAAHGNFDFHQWDPTEVDSHPAGDSAFGVSQLTGNGWEWTSTKFGPFPGFKPFAFYPGYSQSFFDEEHYVLKGASPRTDSCFLRRSFRNWFRPDYPYVYGSFRLIEQ